MHPFRLSRAALAVASFALPLAAGAALIDRGQGLIYDTDRNITWAQDVSLLDTRYDADPTHLVADIIAKVKTVSDGHGTTHTLTTADFEQSIVGVELGTWWGDMAFAQSLTLGGASGWRLPTVLQPDGYCFTPAGGPSTGACRNSELGHLFYDELGGAYLASITVVHNASYALFKNVEGNNDFWTGSTYVNQAPGTIAGVAAYFETTVGQQDVFYDFTAFATPWVVHDGDVGNVKQPGPTPVGAVPEPAVVSLMFAGMGAIGVVGRRRRASVARRTEAP